MRWPGGATGQEGPELLGEEGSGGKVSVGKAGALNWRRSLGQIWVGWGPPQSPVGDRDWVGTGELCSWVSPQAPLCAPSLPTPQFFPQVLCTSSWFRAPSHGTAVPSGGSCDPRLPHLSELSAPGESGPSSAAWSL